MKRILALCLTVLLVLSLAACGNDSNDNNDDGANVVQNDFKILYNGTVVVTGVEAKEIIPKLGNYTSEDGEACGTNEKDVIYTLSGLEIETHVSGSSEIVRQIKILNDSVETEKGITIGSTKDDVVSAYGKNYEESSTGALRYAGDTSAIEFHFGASGAVSNIYIRKK